MNSTFTLHYFNTTNKSNLAQAGWKILEDHRLFNNTKQALFTTNKQFISDRIMTNIRNMHLLF